MNIESEIVLSITIYKLTSLLIGLLSLYMGYKLFISGVWGNAGDVDVKFENNRILVRRAAPGTFFAILGTIIVCFTVFRGMRYDVPPPKLQATSQQAKVADVAKLPEVPPVSGEIK